MKLKPLPRPEAALGLPCLWPCHKHSLGRLKTSGHKLVEARNRTFVRRNEGQTHSKRGLSCQAFLGPLMTSLPSSATGWLIAGTALTAIRFGRKVAEDEQQLKIQRGSMEFDLDENQEQLLRRTQERRRLQGDSEAATRRIEEAQARAKQEQAARNAENKRLKQAIEEQKRRAEEVRRAERAAYEQKEAEAQAELQAKAEKERELRAQKEEERRQQELEKRREQAELERQREQDRLNREAEARRQEQLVLEQKAAERREIKKLSKTFSLTLDSTVDLDTPPEGTETTGRLPKEAMLSLTVTAGTLAGGNTTHGPVVFESTQACVDQLIYQTALGCLQGANRFAANARLQNMMGEGPLQSMSEAELVHWMRCAAVRSSTTLSEASKVLLETFAKRRQSLTKQCQVRTVRSILPEGDKRKASNILANAIQAVEDDQAQQAKQILNNFVDEEEILLSEEPQGGEIPEYAGVALGLALFLDTMWDDRPSKRMEASPWYESAANLACSILTDKTANAPKDSLQEVSQLISAVLPEEQVIGQHLRRLADNNLSEKRRQQQREQEEIIQAEIAERLVEFEWPDKSELSAAKLKEIEASVPIPERVWALKNVGRTQAIGGPEGRSRARQLLERAVSLKKELVGSAKHPGMLPEYDALASLLEREPDWARDVAGLRLRMLSIFSDIAEAFIATGDVTSGVILLEAALKKTEQVVDPRQTELGAATNRAFQLFGTLSDAEKAKVKASRQDASLLDRVIKQFEEELAARQTTGTLLQFEHWNEDGVMWLGSL